MSPGEFVAMFCDHMMHRPDLPVNRIEFKYLEEVRYPIEPGPINAITIEGKIDL